MYKTMYKKELEDTVDKKLDRHKLGSCLCGAIIQVQPFNTTGNSSSSYVASRYPNELLAFWCGLKLLKVFLVDDYSLDLVQRGYVMRHYPELPVTTKDHRGYLACAVHSLADVRMRSSDTTAYDFLGNSDRFFHIESYNVVKANEYIDKLKKSG